MPPAAALKGLFAGGVGVAGKAKALIAAKTMIAAGKRHRSAPELQMAFQYFATLHAQHSKMYSNCVLHLLSYSSIHSEVYGRLSHDPTAR
jgi:hypothetical protein